MLGEREYGKTQFSEKNFDLERTKNSAYIRKLNERQKLAKSGWYFGGIRYFLFIQKRLDKPPNRMDPLALWVGRASVPGPYDRTFGVLYRLGNAVNGMNWIMLAILVLLLWAASQGKG